MPAGSPPIVKVSEAEGRERLDRCDLDYGRAAGKMRKQEGEQGGLFLLYHEDSYPLTLPVFSFFWW